MQSLSLGTRTTGALLVVLVLGSASGFAVQRFVVFPSFLALEQEQANDDVARCRRAIEREIHHLTEWVGDYARWADSWNFMGDRNPKFLEDNFPLPTFSENHLTAVWYVDPTGKVAYGEAHDLHVEGQPAIAMPELPALVWPRDHALLPKIATQTHSGVLLTTRGPMIAATWPVTLNGEGPPRGWVVMLRRLDAAVVKTLVEQTRVEFEIVDVQGDLSPEDREGLARVGSHDAPWTRIADDSVLSVYTTVPDVAGRPALLVRATVPRRIAERGRDALRYAVLSGIGIGLLLLGVGWLLLHRTVLGRVASFSSTVRELANAPAGELASRVEVRGNDELGRLAADFNHMLDGLSQARHELREARDQAEAATRAKATFLSNMSHEIRTPMNGVIGMTDLLLQGHLDAEQREYCETVRSSADSLLAILNDILDFSKIEAGQLGIECIEFDLRATLEQAEQLLAGKAHSKNLELALEIGEGVPDRVQGDPGRLRQVLVNLIGNAVKFTPQGEVLVRVTRQGAASAPASGPVRLLFEVKDTGIGIPPSQRDRLFRMFSQVDASTTRRFGGTGLGLAITKQLVGLMGGEAGVESVEGAGSTFWFTATLQQPVGAPAEHPVPDAVRRGRFLVVDDNDTARRLLQAQLRMWGCRSTGAATGDEALALVARATADGDGFALALVDGALHGPQGESLAQALRMQAPLGELRLVRLTAVGSGGEAESWSQGGFDATVQKPVRQLALHDCLITLLAGAPPLAIGSERAAPASPPPKARPARILLAEDNAVNRLVARTMLERMGHAVVAVVNGKQAVEACLASRFDLVLMDCQMPEMDGYEATAAIRGGELGGRSTPIVAMTANAMQGDRELCLAAGMDDYVSKPVMRDTLDAVIRRWADRGPNSAHVVEAPLAGSAG